jgi:hypothetical protein
MCHLHDRAGPVRADAQDSSEALLVEEAYGRYPGAQVVHGVLVPAEGKADAVQLGDLGEAVEVMLEPREGGDGLRKLVGRGTR